MSRALVLAAFLVVLPLSNAMAQEPDTSKSEAAIEAASRAFEKRMETFGTRAEAIAQDAALSPAQRQSGMTALQAEYQPEIAAFTALITEQASRMAQQALASVDVEAAVAEAMNDPEVKAAIDKGVATGLGVARNSAYANPDAEQMRTYGLIAQYALDQAAEEIEDDGPEATEAVEAPEAPEAPEPPASPASSAKPA